MPTIEELAEELASLRTRVETSESILQIHALKARTPTWSTGGSRKGRSSIRTRSPALRDIADLFTPDGVWDGDRGWAWPPAGRPSSTGWSDRP